MNRYQSRLYSEIMPSDCASSDSVPASTHIWHCILCKMRTVRLIAIMRTFGYRSCTLVYTILAYLLTQPDCAYANTWNETHAVKFIIYYKLHNRLTTQNSTTSTNIIRTQTNTHDRSASVCDQPAQPDNKPNSSISRFSYRTLQNRTTANIATITAVAASLRIATEHRQSTDGRQAERNARAHNNDAAAPSKRVARSINVAMQTGRKKHNHSQP